MKALTQEILNVQNPALGAAILWRFSCAYTENHPQKAAAPIPLIFTILPIVLHEKTVSLVESTRKTSGLRAFAAKFATSENRIQDLLIAIHDRTLKFRELSLNSIRIAVSGRLLHINTDGTVTPLSYTRPMVGISCSVNGLMKSAEKLGVWYSQLTIHEITSALKVRI